MKRRTSTSPVVVYSYGCLPPTEGAEHVEDQLRKAHRYRNSLCEIERARREGIAAVQRDHDSLGPLLAAIESTETTIAEAKVDARLTHAGGRRERDAAAPERAALSEMIAAAQGDLSVLRMLRGWAKTALRDDEGIKAAYRAVDDRAREAIKAARNSDDAPFWGTYLKIEEVAQKWRASADPPRFERYDGSGKLAVQIQGGLTAAEALSGTDTRLRISTGRAHPRPGTGGERTDGTVSIRVSSNGRAPVWATFPVVTHRPLPADGKITWAWILRRREGLRYRYSLQLTVESESARRAPTGRGTIAVDIGCREQQPTSIARVATWLDSAGARGDIVPPTQRLSSRKSRGKGRRKLVPSGLDKAESLRGIRDRNLDECKARLAAYRQTTIEMPPELRERLQHVHIWRSPARVGALYRDWTRHAGDAETYARLGAWLKQDRHLLDWETRERGAFYGARRERYRVFATEVARKYATIVVAKRVYLREERPPEESPSTVGHAGRALLREAAPSELRDAIKAACAKYGTRYLEVPLEGDTAWAVDWKICERLLASAEVASAPADPLAAASTSNNRGSRTPSRRRRLGTAPTVDPLAKQDVSPRVVR